MRRTIFALLMFGTGCVHASNGVWSALVLATNETPAREVPAKLEAFAPTIKKVFGYNSLYLLGDRRKEIDSGTEDWLVPSEDFFFQLTSLRREETHYAIRLELFRDKSPLLTTEVRLARNAPLYIRGPQWGAGQLILLLEIR